jgi:hypothetical protein
MHKILVSLPEAPAVIGCRGRACYSWHVTRDQYAFPVQSKTDPASIHKVAMLAFKAIRVLMLRAVPRRVTERYWAGTVYFGPLGLCFRFGVTNSWNEKMAKAVSGIMITAPKIQMRGANVRPMTITAKRTVKRFAFI